MANSYTAIPNIVPGNLKVNGTLTVSGGQIAMGKFQRQYRIQELANGQFVETVNVDRIAGAQDDATTASLMRVIYATGPPFAVATEPAGSPMADTYLLNQQPTALQVLSNELRVGMGGPYVRLAKSSPYVGEYTFNLGTDLVTRDDTSKAATYLGLAAITPQISYQIMNAAGVVMTASPFLTFWTDYTVHTSTGAPGLALIGNHQIRAGFMGVHSAIVLTVAGVVTVAAGGAILIIISWGGQNYTVVTFPSTTSGNFRATIIIANLNVSNSQHVSSMCAYNAIVTTPLTAGGTVDTNADLLLGVYTQATLAADSITVAIIEAHLLNNYGPI